MSWKLYRRLQRKGWSRCSSILRSRMIFRTLSDRTTGARMSRFSPILLAVQLLTLIFAYILQRKRQASVFALDNADLPESALANDSQ